jgi:uncharacterized membrane protein YfcA
MIEVDIADPAFLAVAIPAVLMAGISKGGFGSGGAFAATPLLALMIGPNAAIGIMLVLLMVMDVTGLVAYWRRWSWPNAKALMIGALPGAAIGMMFFAWTNPDAIRLLIGSIALAFVAFQIARERGWAPDRRRPFSPIRAGFWGMVTGFTSFVSHAGGPPTAIHLLGQRLDKSTYQATTVLVFWWVNLIKVPPYFALGLFGGGNFQTALWLTPVAILGMMLGVAAHSRVSDVWFFRLIYGLLAITGTKIVWDGLSGLI